MINVFYQPVKSSCPNPDTLSSIQKLDDMVKFFFCRYEQAKIAAIVAEAGELFHIGLKYHDKYHVFQWASGEDVSYTNWGQNQPGK